MVDKSKKEQRKAREIPVEGIELENFDYTRLSRQEDSAERINWIELQEFDTPHPELDRGGPRREPYNMAAEAFRRNGDLEGARRILIAQHSRFGRREKEREKGRGLNWILGWFRYLWSQVLRVTVGYGYKPARILWAITFTVLIFGSCIYFAADHGKMSHIKPSNNFDGYPKLNSWVYATDILLPVVDLNQAAYWAPVSEGIGWWAEVLGWLVAILGWIFIGIFVAGITGIVRKV